MDPNATYEILRYEVDEAIAYLGSLAEHNVAEELGLDFNVYQHDHEWWVEVDKIQNPFIDGMTFTCQERD